MGALSAYKRLLPFLRPYALGLTLAVVSMALVAGMNALPAYLVKPIMDEIFYGKNREYLILIVAALPVIFLLKGVFFYHQFTAMRDIGQRVIRDVRNRIFEHLQTLPVGYFTAHKSGVLTARVVNDVQFVQRALVEGLTGAFLQATKIIALLFVVFYQNWRFALLASVIFPIAVLPLSYFGKRLRRWGKRSQEKMGDLNSIMLEAVQGVRVVKAFGMEDFETRRFHRENNSMYTAFVKSIRINGITAPLMELFGALGTSAFLYFAGTLVIKEQMTPGEFFSFLVAMGLLYEPMKALNGLNQRLQEGAVAGERIFEILDAENPITDREGAHKLEGIRECISFESVEFAYRGEKVLDGIEVTVRPGEVLAIVGGSGAGKTTLVNLIPRFWDVTGGRIAIDGTDIRDLTIKSLRAHIGIVTQETILFNDTVRANIAYGDIERTDAEVEAAARAANAHGFVSALPEGYDTLVGEQGMTLSGGQRQRIAIARAILKNAPILILDEATSALDTESEREVQKAIEALIANRTTFVIAHRLSTIRHATRIIVLRDGQIVETGKHEELLALEGEYHRLYTQQFEPVEGERSND